MSQADQAWPTGRPDPRPGLGLGGPSSCWPVQYERSLYPGWPNHWQSKLPPSTSGAVPLNTHPTPRPTHHIVFTANHLHIPRYLAPTNALEWHPRVVRDPRRSAASRSICTAARIPHHPPAVQAHEPISHPMLSTRVEAISLASGLLCQHLPLPRSSFLAASALRE